MVSLSLRHPDGAACFHMANKVGGKNSKQLRTRDCKNCSISLYSLTDPIIETSQDMRFSTFNGAYPGIKQVSSNCCSPGVKRRGSWLCRWGS